MTVSRPRVYHVSNMPYNPVLTEETAREIVLCRLDEADSASGARPLKVFAEAMFACGLTPKVLSASTLTLLFRGELFPELTDREGQRFVWSRIPRASRGRRACFGRERGNRLARLEKRVARLCDAVRTLARETGVEIDQDILTGRPGNDEDDSL